MRDIYKECFEVDRDTKEYLDEFKKDIKEAINRLEEHIKSLLESNIAPIQEQQKKHTEDIRDLYEKDREMRDRVGSLEGRVKTLEDDKQDNRFSTEMKIVIVVALIGVGASVLIAIFGG